MDSKEPKEHQINKQRVFNKVDSISSMANRKEVPKPKGEENKTKGPLFENFYDMIADPIPSRNKVWKAM